MLADLEERILGVTDQMSFSFLSTIIPYPIKHDDIPCIAATSNSIRDLCCPSQRGQHLRRVRNMPNEPAASVKS